MFKILNTDKKPTKFGKQRPKLQIYFNLNQIGRWSLLLMFRLGTKPLCPKVIPSFKPMILFSQINIPSGCYQLNPMTKTQPITLVLSLSIYLINIQSSFAIELNLGSI